MKILVLPRDSNPYQGLLYGALGRLGVRSAYVGELTPSHTLNLLLLPFELLVRRLTGWRALHVHWVFGFALPGSERWPRLRRVARLWFLLVLALAGRLGLRVIWTAHNTLPHGQVFDDDAAGRRSLVRHSDLVIAHTRATLDSVARLGAPVRRGVVVPHGSLRMDMAEPSPPAGPRREVLFFGKIAPYKGAEDLLSALARVPGPTPLRVTVAGECADPALARRLEDQARALGPDRVQLRLRHLPEDELTALLAASDLVALPFREVTTSGTVGLALDHARPVVIPDLPALADVPAGCALRYDGSVDGLARTLERAAGLSPTDLRAMARAATEAGVTAPWPDVARRTARAIEEVAA